MKLGYYHKKRNCKITNDLQEELWNKIFKRAHYKIRAKGYPIIINTERLTTINIFLI